MKHWKLFAGFLAAIWAVVVVAGFAATSAGTKPYDPNLMASWVQAVGSIAAIVGAFAVVRFQLNEEKGRRSTEHKIAEAADLLALQQISAELAQMLVFSNFEKSNEEEGTIYPDAALEFESMASLLASFSAVRMATLGELEVLFRLRRIAQISSRIFRIDKEVIGNRFVRRHRNFFSKIEAECQGLSLQLAEKIEAKFPGYFTNQVRKRL